MRKLPLFLLALMLCSFFDASAFGTDDDDDRRRRRRRRKGPKYEVGINPLGYLFGNYNVIGAAHLSESKSLFLEFAYSRVTSDYSTFDPNTGVPIITNVVSQGFSIAPEFRHYFNPNNDNDGWFLGGYLNIRSLTTDGKPYFGFNSDDELVNYDLSTFGIAPGATGGYGWAFDNGITLTLWAGVGYSIVYSETKDPNFVPSTDPTNNIYNQAVNVVNRLDSRGGFTVGYRF